MNKKISLLMLFLCMLLISSFSVTAALFSFAGDVSLDGTAPTGAPVELYINYVRDDTATAYVGGCATCDPAQYATAFEANVGDTLYFQIYGINATQGETTLTVDDMFGRNFDLTANKSADGAVCGYSNACSGGYCCSGATEYTDGSGTGTCQATVCAAGGGGGGGGGGAVTTNITTNTTIIIPTITDVGDIDGDGINDTLTNTGIIGHGVNISNNIITFTTDGVYPNRTLKYYNIDTDTLTDTGIRNVGVAFSNNIIALAALTDGSEHNSTLKYYNINTDTLNDTGIKMIDSNHIAISNNIIAFTNDSNANYTLKYYNIDTDTLTDTGVDNITKNMDIAISNNTIAFVTYIPNDYTLKYYDINTDTLIDTGVDTGGHLNIAISNNTIAIRTGGSLRYYDMNTDALTDLEISAGPYIAISNNTIALTIGSYPDYTLNYYDINTDTLTDTGIDISSYYANIAISNNIIAFTIGDHVNREIAYLTLSKYAPVTDDDEDGFTSDVDCNDTNPNIHPGVEENTANGIDDDCDGLIDENAKTVIIPNITYITPAVTDAEDIDGDGINDTLTNTGISSNGLNISGNIIALTTGSYPKILKYYDINTDTLTDIGIDIGYPGYIAISNNIIAFGNGSYPNRILKYYDINTDTLTDTGIGISGPYIAISNNIIAFTNGSSPNYILKYYDINTDTLIDTGIGISVYYANIAISNNIIAFGNGSYPNKILKYYDINTDTLTDTGIEINWYSNIDISNNIIAFTNGSYSNQILKYYDINTDTLTDTGISVVGIAISNNIIVFRTGDYLDYKLEYYDINTDTLTDTGIEINWYSNIDISNNIIAFRIGNEISYLTLSKYADCAPLWVCNDHDVSGNCISTLDLNDCYSTTGLNDDLYSGDYSEFPITNITDSVIGDETSINSTDNVTVLIENKSINDWTSMTSTLDIKFEQGNNVLAEFSYNFSEKVLDLTNITVERENGVGAVKGYILVRGIQQEETKTLYLHNVSPNFNWVCIKDEDISNKSEITPNCQGTNEYHVQCNNQSTSGYKCEDLGNDVYRITGLQHSGVIQADAPQGGPPGGGGGGGGGGADPLECTESWSCTAWTGCSKSGTQIKRCMDENGCGTENSKPDEERSCTYVPPEPRIVEENVVEETTTAGSEVVEEEQKPTGFTRITGAAIGNALNSKAGIISARILLIIIVTGIVSTIVLKKKSLKKKVKRKKRKS